MRLADGSFMTWTLVSALAAVGALVWLRRRRRHTADTRPDFTLRTLPPAVAAARRHMRRASTIPAQRQAPSPSTSGGSGPDLPVAAVGEPAGGRPRPDTTERGTSTSGESHADTAAAAAHASSEPDTLTLFAGGVALAGPGAPDAARALLIGVLAGQDKGRQVLADRATMDALGIAEAGQMPALRVAADLDAALAALETALLERSRLLDEHNRNRDRLDPNPITPLLALLTASNDAPPSRRVAVVAGLGEPLAVTLVLLGSWPDQRTLRVRHDGAVTGHTADEDDFDADMRLSTLTQTAASDALTAIAEAFAAPPPPRHERSSAQPTTEPATAPPDATPAVSSPAVSPPPAARAADQPPDGPARLRVLGPPDVLDLVRAGRPLRAKARELAVFLACHPDGASTREIGEHLEPDARLRESDARVHTNVSNLRHVLARAGHGAHRFVDQADGRYRLRREDVRVDLWEMRALLQDAAVASGPARLDLLRRACDLCHAPLAEGCDYEWIEPHRETVRQWATGAHQALAEELIDIDAAAALDVLAKASRLDRYNEHLYRLAMRAHAVLGDTAAVKDGDCTDFG